MPTANQVRQVFLFLVEIKNVAVVVGPRQTGELEALAQTAILKRLVRLAPMSSEQRMDIVLSPQQCLAAAVLESLEPAMRIRKLAM
jgi:hypothetical protein